MRYLLLLSTLMTLMGSSLAVQAAEPEAEAAPLAENGPRLGEASTQRWQVGMKIRAVGGPCFGVYGTVPVPIDWPEQQVRVVDQQISPQVQAVKYRELDGGVKQMLIAIPRLNAGDTATALVTFEVTRHTLLPPEDPTVFVVPRRVPRDIGQYLGASPYIESRHAQIRSLAREVVEGKEGAWEQTEAIYDWVREHVKYENGELKGALAALRDGEGDCEELTSLFIALCRANRIPARTVWVPDHCYPEFYLEDQQGSGHWIPCQAAGTRDFGGIPELRPILQKGDNFKVPEKRGPQRYVAEFLKVRSVGGGGQPEVEFVRELLPAVVGGAGL